MPRKYEKREYVWQENYSELKEKRERCNGEENERIKEIESEQETKENVRKHEGKKITVIERKT